MNPCEVHGRVVAQMDQRVVAVDDLDVGVLLAASGGIVRAAGQAGRADVDEEFAGAPGADRAPRR